MVMRQTKEGDFLSTITPCCVTSDGKEAVAVETLFCTSTAPISMSYPGSKYILILLLPLEVEEESI